MENMKKVYVVTQDWDNGEDYDLHLETSKNICVCSSLDEAKAYIANVKAKIMAEALAITGAKFGERAYEFVPDDGKQCTDDVWFKYDEPYDSPFGGLDYDEFTWYIEPFDLIGS